MNSVKAILCFIICTCFVINMQGQNVSTLAGSGTAGNSNGTGTSASFTQPTGICADPSGNIYVADFSNNLIRKITPAGLVTTFAGSGSSGSIDDVGTSASFNNPYSICLDASGNFYVADFNNHKIRKITPAGIVTTFAGSGIAGSANGTGIAASFKFPSGICTDASGNIYVTDTGNNKIRKITSTGVVSTLAGSGVAGSTDATGTAATFNAPVGICVDASGNLYLIDTQNNKIRKITSAGVVTTLAGSGILGNVNGVGTAASFSAPEGICIDTNGDLYIADLGNHKIRKCTSAGVVSDYAGTGVFGNLNGPLLSATFGDPDGICFDPFGNLYISDIGNQNHNIRVILSCQTPLEPTNITPSNNQTICSGLTSVLTATSTGNVNWYSTPTSTVILATGTSFTTSPLSAGNYTFYAEASTCTVSANRTAITVTVNESPTISVNSGTICSGNSFSVNPTGADIYTITGNSFVVTPTITTTYSITGTSTEGCLSANTAISSITVNSLPDIIVISSNTLLCTGQTVSLTASGAETYLWNTSATTSVIAVSPTITTNYTVTGTDINGCENYAVYSQSVSLCTGINEITNGANDSYIYPNPNSGRFFISSISAKKVTVINSIGEIIRDIDLSKSNTEIEIYDLKSGIYFVRFINDKRIITEKIIVQ